MMGRHAASPLTAVDAIDVHRLRLDALELLAWRDVFTAGGDLTQEASYRILPAEHDAWMVKAAALLQEIAR